MALSAVVHDVVVGAREDDDIELIALWHARGADALLAEAATEDSAKVRSVRAVREIAVDTGAVTYELYDGIRPPPDFCGYGGELGAWWAGEDGHDDVLPKP
ncbi:hypothetical protein [Nocardia bovistercoris]|uniref:Uncharacterized protein n=1 Tax=Nocardia bovistercoris TaxID=2785916 RepID=A0A931N3S9_9NOCA|nr:hypothetical protein [Nocardia bovistercoris]MBH0776873.1 hypothetical protein [Nocardia bovistercoris]